jgi:hypothetical protein
MNAASAPYFLLAGGIVLVLLGYFIANLGSRSSGRDYIHPKMSDKEIARRMSENQGNPIAGIIVLIGFLAIFASIVWRLLRFIV